VTRHLGWAKLKSGRSLALVRVQLPDKTHAKAVAALLADQEQMLPPERRRAWQFFARSLLRRRADEPIINFYLGLLDGQLAGHGAIICSPPIGTMNWVATRPQYRGQGIATILVNTAMADFWTHSGQALFLTTPPGSIAERIYVKLGFRRCQFRDRPTLSMMRFQGTGFFGGYFAPRRSHVRDLTWADWPRLTALNELPEGDQLRCARYLLAGPCSFDPVFPEIMHDLSRRIVQQAKVLVSESGAVVGYAFLGPRPGSRREFLLDLYLHAGFADQGETMLRALQFPRGRTIIYLDYPSSLKDAALIAAGFTEVLHWNPMEETRFLPGRARKFDLIKG